MTVVQNFIEGKLVDSVGGGTMALVDPTTGDQYGPPRCPTKRTSTTRTRRGQGVRDWKRTTPSHRQKALLDFADELEKRAAALVEAEGRNTGKPNHVTAAEEIPQMLDQTRFFAGRRGCSRASRPASIWRATPRGSAASRSASSGR